MFPLPSAPPVSSILCIAPDFPRPSRPLLIPRFILTFVQARTTTRGVALSSPRPPRPPSSARRVSRRSSKTGGARERPRQRKQADDDGAPGVTRPPEFPIRSSGVTDLKGDAFKSPVDGEEKGKEKEEFMPVKSGLKRNCLEYGV